MLEPFGRQISEHVSQLFRSQCTEVTPCCIALRRSEARGRLERAGCSARWLAGLQAGFESPVCESLESGSSRSGRVSLVCSLIRDRL